MNARDAAMHGFFRAVDTRDWDTVAAMFGDEVTVDYTSLFGGEVETLAADDLLARWQGLLPGFDATMHLLGPLVGDDDGDTVECNVRGYHHLDGETWMVAGWYTLGTHQGDGRVRITSIRIETSYEQGSRALVERAQERALQ